MVQLAVDRSWEPPPSQKPLTAEIMITRKQARRIEIHFTAEAVSCSTFVPVRVKSGDCVARR